MAIYSIGSQGMVELKQDQVYDTGTIIIKDLAGINKEFAIVGEEWLGTGQPCIALDLSQHSEAAPQRDKARGAQGIGSFWVTDRMITLEEVEELRLAFAQKRQSIMEQVKAKEDQEKQDRERGKAIFETAMPKGAKAVIVASFMKDESDPTTDYFHASTKKAVIIAWSFSERNDFSEMRKAAAGYDPTRELATADKDSEHRENYTGGSGYFLGAKYTGWQIKKVPLSNYSLPGLYQKAANPELFQVPPTPAAHQLQPQAVDGITITQNDEKQGIEIRFSKKPAQEIIDKLKQHKWRWSNRQKCWYIKNTQANLAFAESLGS